MKLFEHFIELPEEKTFLMRIFAIAQYFGIVLGTTEIRIFSVIEIIKNSSIISWRNGKSLFCKPFTIFYRRFCTFLIQQLHQRSILSFRSNNNYIFKIFRSSTYQRDTADIDFLDNGAFVSSRSYSFFKRIKINNHQIYFRNLIFCNLFLIAFQFTTT